MRGRFMVVTVVAAALFLTSSRAEGDFSVGAKFGGDTFGVEILGPRWFDSSLCLTFAAIAGGDEQDDLDRPDDPPLIRTATQAVDHWSLRAGVLWFPWPKAEFRPYVGAGAGVSFRDWELREQTTVNQVVVEQTRDTDRDTTWMAWATAGIEVELSESWALIGEVQYDAVDDFHGVDLGGVSLFGGIRWRF